MDFPVLISYANDGYFNFAKNMLISLDKTCKHHKIHFYCLDHIIYEKVKKLEFQNIQLTFELYNENDVSYKFEIYDSIQYIKITHTKMNILKNALKKFQFIHFIDCDVVCVKEPTLEHYKKYENYDIVFQYDGIMNSASYINDKTIHYIWACTGNTSLRNTRETHFLLDKIIEYQNMYKNKNDQECLYQCFLDNSIDDIRNYKPTKLYTYEINEYTNGYWLNNNIGTLDDTYFFHANHVIGDVAKMDLLKKANHFFI